MAIRTGDKAAAFTLPAAPGDSVDVGAIFGTEPVVLLFFPLAFSSVCTDELCAMRDAWDRWKDLDARVFGISIDSPFVTKKFREELGLPFPLLSDFNKSVASSYGALHDDLKGLKGVTKRAVFVIDRTGNVVYDWVSDDPGKMPDLEEVLAVVDEMKVG